MKAIFTIDSHAIKNNDFVSVLADYPNSATQDVTTTTVVAQPTTVQMVVPFAFGPLPVNMTCPHCHAQVVTAITYEPGVLTWLFCGGIALFG